MDGGMEDGAEVGRDERMNGEGGTYGGWHGWWFWFWFCSRMRLIWLATRLGVFFYSVALWAVFFLSGL